MATRPRGKPSRHWADQDLSGNHQHSLTGSTDGSSSGGRTASIGVYWGYEGTGVPCGRGRNFRPRTPCARSVLRGWPSTSRRSRQSHRTGPSSERESATPSTINSRPHDPGEHPQRSRRCIEIGGVPYAPVRFNFHAPRACDRRNELAPDAAHKGRDAPPRTWRLTPPLLPCHRIPGPCGLGSCWFIRAKRKRAASQIRAAVITVPRGHLLPHR